MKITKTIKSALALLLLCWCTVAPATDHFWVGGTGNISDATNHWSLT